MSRKRFTAEQWWAWFQEFEQNDLTVQQFCDAKGTTANTFYNWRRRLREEQPAQENQNTERPSFVSVNLASSVAASSVAASRQVEIELGDGIVARVANDHQSLKPILEVLHELKAKR